jgi:hypothetical protein
VHLFVISVFEHVHVLKLNQVVHKVIVGLEKDSFGIKLLMRSKPVITFKHVQ